MTEPNLIFTTAQKPAVPEMTENERNDTRIDAAIESLKVLVEARAALDAKEVPMDERMIIPDEPSSEAPITNIDNLFVRAYSDSGVAQVGPDESYGDALDPWETGDLGCSREHAEFVIDEIDSTPYQTVAKTALRFNTGKPELHYLLTFPEALRGIARVTTYGSKKYPLYNYTRGAPASESVSCALRHLLAWFSGEDTDPESGLCHLDAFVWNAARLTHEMATRPDLDNRPHVVMQRASEPDKD